MAAPQRDYYEVLGVARDADAKAIRDAFRRLALRWHPDRCKEPGAEERFKEIAAAYAVLSDPRKRADYDARGFAGLEGMTPEDLFRGVDLGDLFGGLGFDFDTGAGGGGLFERLFGRRRRAGPAQGANLEVELEIPLERVRTGGEETLRVARPSPCGACGGSGARAGTQPRPCAACEGRGQRVTSRKGEGVFIQQIATCGACGGRGQIIDEKCPECRGEGRVTREETLQVKIPVGVEEGMVLRIGGHGLPSPERGGRAGDLYVAVRTREDPRFQRRGADLVRSERLGVADAVLGTEIEVPTLDGPVRTRIPPGTQPDAILRLRGKGLPEFGGGRRGDLYVELRLEVPAKLTREERALWERLRDVALSRSRR